MRSGRLSMMMASGVTLMASVASGHDHDALRAAYNATRVPALGEALREAAAAQPFHVRVAPRGEASEGADKVRLTLELFLERGEPRVHAHALELMRLFADSAWEPGQPTRGLQPVRLWSGERWHGFLVDPVVLRAAGLHSVAATPTMSEQISLKVRWYNAAGAVVEEQTIAAPVSASCQGLPLTSLCVGCGEGMEIGAKLRKKSMPAGVTVEVPSCALEVAATLAQPDWAQTARMEVEVQGLAASDAAEQVAHEAWRRLLPPHAQQRVCAITQANKGATLASWSYDASGRPLEQRGWGTDTGSKRFVYAQGRLLEMWDGNEQVERVIYGRDGRMLGTWLGKKRCLGTSCEEVVSERSAWVVMADGSEQHLETREGRWPFEGGAGATRVETSYVLERRQGAWDAVSVEGGGLDQVHDVLMRDVLERDSFLRLTQMKEVARLRVQVERWRSGSSGAMSFEALISAHDEQDRPLDGVYVEHKEGKSRVARVTHDLTSCHKKSGASASARRDG